MIKKKEVIKFNVEDLHIAEVKYFSLENKGIELTDAVGYVFLNCRGHVYINPISFVDNYPIFKRVPYSNTTSDFEDFGSKVMLESNGCYLESGPCYVLSKVSTREIFEKDVVTQEDIEDFILNSDYYFIDRKAIAEERIKKHPIKMANILRKDAKNEEKMLEFFAERGVQLQKK